MTQALRSEPQPLAPTAPKGRPRRAMTGNDAVAEAMRQIEPDVVAAYPITPISDLLQTFSGFVHNGQVATEFVLAESEHSAMSACLGASAAGARVMTATASQGLAYMGEVLFIASGMRLPIVLAVGNRALSAPLNIMCDHSDSMAMRDSGWLQLYCKDGQEAYDTVLQAVRISEHPQVRLPVMICIDGFLVTHALGAVEPLNDEEARGFVGEPPPRESLFDEGPPRTFGATDYSDSYFEHKSYQEEAMRRALAVVDEISAAYGALSGRRYGLLEPYRLEDAEVAVVSLGSAAATVEGVVDSLRGQGLRCGALRIRSFRPFPGQAVAEALAQTRAVAVLDRCSSPGGSASPLHAEVVSALATLPAPPRCVDRVFGLGGRDLPERDLEALFRKLEGLAAGRGSAEPFAFIGLRR